MRVGLKYHGPNHAIESVADSYSKWFLRLFKTALHRNLYLLYDGQLVQLLCRLVEPFSRIEITHIAELIELPLDNAEKKLSQLILYKKFAGTLDQGAGCLVIFEDPKTDTIFPATLDMNTKFLTSLLQRLITYNIFSPGASLPLHCKGGPSSIYNKENDPNRSIFMKFVQTIN